MNAGARSYWYGLMVSTQDSESCDPSSSLSRNLIFSHHLPSPGLHHRGRNLSRDDN